jgi:hypothetical protein
VIIQEMGSTASGNLWADARDEDAGKGRAEEAWMFVIVLLPLLSFFSVHRFSRSF